jgi:hypothetical protein
MAAHRNVAVHRLGRAPSPPISTYKSRPEHLFNPHRSLELLLSSIPPPQGSRIRAPPPPPDLLLRRSSRRPKSLGEFPVSLAFFWSLSHEFWRTRASFCRLRRAFRRPRRRLPPRAAAGCCPTRRLLAAAASSRPLRDQLLRSHLALSQ